jgi:hypothetical protein
VSSYSERLAAAIREAGRPVRVSWGFDPAAVDASIVHVGTEKQPPWPFGVEESLEAAAALRRTRAYQAGVSFGVPAEARPSHSAALAKAVQESMSTRLAAERALHEARREELEFAQRAARLALGLAGLFAVLGALRSR